MCPNHIPTYTLTSTILHPIPLNEKGDDIGSSAMQLDRLTDIWREMTESHHQPSPPPAVSSLWSIITIICPSVCIQTVGMPPPSLKLMTISHKHLL